MIDIWQEIYQTISRNKLRTFLTGFAVAWGIFMLIVMLGFMNGIVNALEKNSSGMADDVISIYPGHRSNTYKGMPKWSPIKFKNEDVKETEKFRSNVKKAIGLVRINNVFFNYGKENVKSDFYGATPALKEMNYLIITNGRFINELDLKEKRHVCVIPQNKADILFGKNRDCIGKRLKVDKLLYTIVGVYDKVNSRRERDFYAPITTLQQIYHNTANTLQQISFKIKDLPSIEANDAFEKKYRENFSQRHLFDKEDQSALWFVNMVKNFIQNRQGKKYLNIAVWVLGIFSLTSGIVGVGNIMLITVRERRKEFGIRKALGAKSSSILWLVIAESVAITTFFGYIGMFLGIFLTEMMNQNLSGNVIDIGVAKIVTFYNATVDINIAIEATITLIIAGTLAGFFPARKATKIPPTEALRSE